MALNKLVFQRQFDRFDQQILDATGERFTSFHEGLPDDWESYKEALRTIARDRLEFHRWRERDVGRGLILDKLIRSIEVSETADVPRNNLVAWQPRYGPNSQSHRALLKARTDRLARRSFERWCFEFFHGDLKYEKAFQQFIELAGRRYDLIAYLFFLKDWKRFMPIAPATFDAAFSALGVELKTSQNCGWNNYSRFNDTLAEVRDALRAISELDARLIDAHSFCWILVRLGSADRPQHVQVIPLPLELTDAIAVEVESADPSDRDSAAVMHDSDFVERDAKQRRLGKMAEDIAFVAEQRRLRESERPDLADAIERVSDRPALGYDMRSFEGEGRRRFIEVKATRQVGKRLSFFLTRNELLQSRLLPSYYFYLVTGVLLARPKVYAIPASSIRTNRLAPIAYVASVERGDHK